MNFLLRPAQTAPPPVTEQPSSLSGTDGIYVTKHVTTLEGLIAEDPFSQSHAGEDREVDADGNEGENGSGEGTGSKDDLPAVENYIDVAEDEGCIIIPDKNLPDNWSEASDMGSFRSLDRHFLFPGEQVHMLACLSAYKQDIEVITPFKVAALMSKNGNGKNTKKQNGNVRYEIDAACESGEVSPISHDVDQDSDNLSENIGPQKDISSGESLLRMEDRKRQTERLLQKFKNSHFFVRISESDEQLWSKRSSPEESFESSLKKRGSLNAIIDRGNFDASVSGGLARNAINCCSLPNGDILVLLQVNVGVDFMRDPILEILQFEKYQDRNLRYESQHNSDCESKDPCGDLLKWLLPLDNSIAPPSRPVSPPTLSSNSSIRSTSTKSNFSSSSGSQLFSFGHFRSYSMSSLPPNTVAPAPVPVATPSSRPNIDLEDWDQFASQKVIKSQKPGSEGLLSFRGVPLEPDRFSVRCGLEGIYKPGRRWRRKIDIIQPIEIRSFAADCNADDILCVQIKNVSPANAPDIVIFLDAITVVFEEVSKGGPPISLPFTCIEPGDGHSLPNLALRRGEEHSFILKQATLMWKNTKGPRDRNSQSSHSQAGSNLSLPANTLGGIRNASTSDLYAILVSCRSNYTASKIFFKQTTSWRPRISRDLMISVASEMSRENFSPCGGTQLPVQVLTLQATNLTSEDLTLTVFAPASFTSPPSVVSLNSSPTSPVSPFISHSESVLPVNGERRSSAMESTSSASPAFINQRVNVDGGLWSASFCEQISDVLPSTDSGCTHLWLQSRVPLGSVPAQSTATVKLEVLPLTDGIITLDSLQIDVREKGMTYIPEHSLKINATSSIATGIL